MSPVIVALQSRYASDDPTAALVLDAASMTPLGASTVTFGAAGATGDDPNGDVVRCTDLAPTAQAIASAGLVFGHLTHKGSFRVWCRLYRPTSNTGEMAVALEWGDGDYGRPSTNDPVVFAAGAHEGKWLLADLGTVHISPEADHWELRVVVSSTVVGDEIDLDRAELFPAGAPGERDCYGVASGTVRFETPTDFLARDEFNHSFGSLIGSTAPIGGDWAELGDTTDFEIDLEAFAYRFATSDAGEGQGQYAYLDGITPAGVVVQAKIWRSGIIPPGVASFEQMVTARLVDANNNLRGGLTVFTLDGTKYVGAVVKKRIGGVTAPLAGPVPLWPAPDSLASYPERGVRLHVEASGQFWLWVSVPGAGGATPVLAGHDADLATGGTLEDGRVGLYDCNTSATHAMGGFYDDFFAFSPSLDAAIYAGQTLEWTHNGVRREPEGGGELQRVSRFTGKYLTLAPGGLEGRDSRIIVRGVQGPELQDGVLLDNDLAAVTATLHAAERGLVVP